MKVKPSAGQIWKDLSTPGRKFRIIAVESGYAKVQNIDTLYISRIKESRFARGTAKSPNYKYICNEKRTPHTGEYPPLFASRDDLMADIEAGLNGKQIREKYKVSQGRLTAALSIYKIGKGPFIDVEKFKLMFDNGKTDMEIARELGTYFGAIQNLRLTLGIKRPRPICYIKESYDPSDDIAFNEQCRRYHPPIEYGVKSSMG